MPISTLPQKLDYYNYCFLYVSNKMRKHKLYFFLKTTKDSMGDVGCWGDTRL